MSQQQCLPLPRRRKRESDEENGTQLSGKLHIDDLSNMDAMAYLAAVSREANHLPEVFVSSTTPSTKKEGNDGDKKSKEDVEKEENKKQKPFVPIDGSAAATSYMLSSRMNIEQPPSSLHIPKSGRVWVEQTCANFSSLRTYLDGCSAAGVGKERSFDVPAMKDGAGWHEFCLGKDEAMGNIGGYFEDNYDHDDQEKDGEDVEHDHHDMEGEGQNGDGMMDKNEEMDAVETNKVDQQNNQNGDDNTDEYDKKENIPPKGHPPSVQLLCQMDQVMTRRVLTHHARFITEEGYKFTTARGAWLYGLLARLEKPLHRDEEATLTCVLRECCKRRANVTVREGGTIANGKELNMLNVIITIIGVYFEQGGRMEELLLKPKSSAS